MPYYKTPINYPSGKISEDTAKINENFTELAKSFVNQDPTTYKVLDADKVDGFHASQTPSANTIPVADSSGKVALGWILQGAGSGLDADTVDGFDASQTPTANTIPVSNSSGKIDDGWLNFVANDPKVKTALNASGDAPIYACRAWVNFDGTTNPPTIRASGNVSSVAKLRTGNYIVHFTVPMPHANYSATANYTYTNTARGAGNDGQAIPWDYQANYVRIFVSDGGGGAVNGKIVSLSIHC